MKTRYLKYTVYANVNNESDDVSTQRTIYRDVVNMWCMLLLKRLMYLVGERYGFYFYN